MQSKRQPPVGDFLVITLVAIATGVLMIAQPELGLAMAVGCLLVGASAVTFFGLRRLGWLKNF
jgi:cell division protein FtsW (lipid II flippase)